MLPDRPAPRPGLAILTPLATSSAMFGLKLDPLTLLFSIGWTALLMGALSFSLARAQPHQRYGLQAWGGAMLAGGGAILLLVQRDHAPLWLSLSAANLLVLVIPVLATEAYCQLLECSTPRRPVQVALLIGVASVLGMQFGWLSHRYTAAGVSAALAITLVNLAAVLWRQRHHCAGAGVWVSGLLVTGTAGAFTLRAAQLLLVDGASAAPAANTRLQIGALLVGALFIVGASLGFFFMVHDRQRREAREHARRDMLTGLYTRAGFFELAERLDPVVPAARFAIVMVDIDHFKAINDTHGHQGGDLVLAHAARLIGNAMRLSDMAGRYGGEEFCLMLHDCDLHEAGRFAQRVVAQAAAQRVRLRDGRQTGYTLSAGYACRDIGADGRPESVSDVIERADQALYRAKHGGRNRAEAAPAHGWTAPPAQASLLPALAPQKH